MNGIMGAEHAENSNEKPNNSKPPQPPIPPDVVNPETDKKPNPKQGNDTQTEPSEPTKIIIVDDKREKDKTGFWANWIYLGNLLTTIAVFVVTLMLFSETQKATSSAGDSATAAQKTYAEQRFNDSVMRYRDSIKSHNDSMNLANNAYIDSVYRRKTFVNDSTSTAAQIQTVKAQIDAFNRSQKNFREENRPYVNILGLNLDTTFRNGFVEFTWTFENSGKFPAIFLGMTTQIAFGTDTTNYWMKSLPYTSASNEIISNSPGIGIPAQTSGTITGGVDSTIKKGLREGKISAYLIGNYTYYSKSLNKHYKIDFIIQLKYVVIPAVSWLKNDETEY